MRELRCNQSTSLRNLTNQKSVNVSGYLERVLLLSIIVFLNVEKYLIKKLLILKTASLKVNNRK